MNNLAQTAMEALWQTDDRQFEEHFHDSLSPEQRETADEYRRNAERIMDGDNVFKRPIEVEDLERFAKIYQTPRADGKYPSVNQAARLSRVPYYVAHALKPPSHLRQFYLGWPPLAAFEEMLAQTAANIIVEYSDHLVRQEQMAHEIITRGLQGDDEISSAQLTLANKVIDRVRGRPTERKETINLTAQLELSPDESRKVAEVTRLIPESSSSSEQG